MLAGCGTSFSPSAPAAALSTTTLSFPETTVAGTSGTVATVTLRNTGEQSLLISGASLSDSSDYKLSTNCGASLASGLSCTYSIQFTPQRAAVLAASLTLTDNSGGVAGTQQVVGITGTGVPAPAPAATLAPSAVTFEAAMLHVAAPSQSVTLSNAGTTPLEISANTFSDTADFQLTSTTCQTSLAPGASCSYSLLFMPQTVGPVSGTFSVTDNSGGVNGVQQTVALTGTGLPGPAPKATLGSAEIAFATQKVDSASDAQLVTLSNTGTAPLLISDIGLSDATNFVATNNCGRSLAAGAGCSVSLAFQPQMAGAQAATLTITDDSGGSPGAQQRVALSGTGLGKLDASLAAWENALRRCATEPVNVVVLGDSRSIVDTTITPGVSGGLAVTFGRKWTDRLRAKLQAMCGSHGSGLIPFRWGAGTNRVNSDYYTAAGSWVPGFGLGPYQGGSISDNLTLRATSSVSINLSVQEDFDQVRMYCSEGPGLNGWTVLVDGVSVVTCGGPADHLNAVVATTGLLPRAIHAITAICSLAPCVGYGMETVRGTTGVSVHNLAVGSCAAECFGLDPASQLAFSDQIQGGHQLVLLELLTNEPGIGYSVDSFRASLGRIIEHERGVSSAPSFLLYAPLQDVINGQAPYYPVTRSVASQYSTEYFDLRDQYGFAFLPQYFGPDQTHENDAGHDLTYQKMTQLLIP